MVDWPRAAHGSVPATGINTSSWSAAPARLATLLWLRRCRVHRGNPRQRCTPVARTATCPSARSPQRTGRSADSRSTCSRQAAAPDPALPQQVAPHRAQRAQPPQQVVDVITITDLLVELSDLVSVSMSAAYTASHSQTISSPFMGSLRRWSTIVWGVGTSVGHVVQLCRLKCFSNYHDKSRAVGAGAPEPVQSNRRDRRPARRPDTQYRRRESGVPIQRALTF